jgi:hypothetical protein
MTPTSQPHVHHHPNNKNHEWDTETLSMGIIGPRRSYKRNQIRTDSRRGREGEERERTGPSRRSCGGGSRGHRRRGTPRRRCRRRSPHPSFAARLREFGLAGAGDCWRNEEREWWTAAGAGECLSGVASVSSAPWFICADPGQAEMPSSSTGSIEIARFTTSSLVDMKSLGIVLS